MDEGDVGGAVGIVLNGRNATHDPLLVVLFEVDETHEALVSSSTVTHRDATHVVASRDTLLTSHQALFRALFGEAGEVRDGHLASGIARWFLLADWHVTCSEGGTELSEIVSGAELGGGTEGA